MNTEQKNMVSFQDDSRRGSIVDSFKGTTKRLSTISFKGATKRLSTISLKGPTKRLSNITRRFSTVSTDAVFELEDALWDPDGSPDQVLALIRDRPALAFTLINEDSWQKGELAIWHLLKMEGVKLGHVQELHKCMNSSFPQRVLHHACKMGCDTDIIVFITEQNRKAPRTTDVDGDLPIFYLLGTCNQKHMPALELLLDLSLSTVKKDIPKFVDRALSNQDCPQEILDDLTNLAHE